MQPIPPSGASQFDLHHPHDSLFKFFLSVSPNIAALLTTYLPPPLAEPVFWQEARVEPGSFLSEEMKATHSDLLVSAPFRGHTFRVYLVIEHKSGEDKDTMAQLLNLLPKVTLHLRAESGAGGFTPVLALVIHHGEQSWKSSTNLFDHYLFPEGCGEAFRRFALGFEAILLDLRLIPMEEIHNIPPVEALLKALKAVKEGLEEPFLEELKVLARGGELKGYLATLLLYLLCTGRSVTKAQVLEVAKAAEDDNLTTDVMTGAQLLIEEGIEKGIEQGKLQGLEQGRLIGQIVFIQEMLGRLPAPSHDLECWTLEQLREELGKLRTEWLSRG